MGDLHNHGIELVRASSLPEIIVQDGTVERVLAQKGDEKKVADTRESTIIEDGDSDIKPRQVVASGDASRSSPREYGLWLRHIWRKFVLQVMTWYKTYILHALFRQREMLPTKDGRHIDLDASRHVPLIDERTDKEFISNSIRSSRYTIWTFFPYQLWFQFTKAANLYFLIIGICQLIPGLSTTGSFTTIVPLLVFLTWSIAREGYDDYRRYRLDSVENRRLARVLYGYRNDDTSNKPQRSLMDSGLDGWILFKEKVRKDIKASLLNLNSND
jgi:phospholipid-translocating ATPase